MHERRKSRNGWRSGSDPALRWLRIGSTCIVMGVFAIIALDGSRSDPAAMALALAAGLVLLGYEGAIKLPGIGRDRNDPQ